MADETQDGGGESKSGGGSKWRGRITACQGLKKQLLKTWQDSVSYRVGKPFKSTPPDDTVNVPVDWARTKNKQSQLFYQVPEVLLRARRPEYASATSVFAAALNFELTERIHAEHMMNECLGDAINATGLAVAKVGYEGTFEDVPMAIEAEGAQEAVGGTQAMPGPTGLPPGADVTGGLAGALPGAPGAMPPPAEPTMVPRPVYECYYAHRISPLHFLWPVEFTGSNWQEANWLGWEGYKPLAEAQRLGWVDESYEGETIDENDWLLIRDDSGTKPTDQFVKFYEIFYRPSAYDAAEKDFRKIKRVVLIDGKDGKAEVLDEDFQWQRQVAPGKWIGMTSFPLKVLHISKVSDLAIPPSDSEIGRPQVRELIKSRSQMVRQRDHALPLRWYDVNQVDTAVADKLRKGKYQDIIPMNGPGDRALGEVARAHYPPENWDFDRVVRTDLDEAWSMGPPQQGIPTPGDTTATEVNTMQTNLNVRLDFERQWVLRFFLEVAMAVGQLMQLFQDEEQWVEIVGPDGSRALQAWNKDTIPGEFVFEAKPDSQLKLDASQQRAEALNVYKLLRQDPLINPVALVGAVLEVHGIDPAKTLVPQQPPKPEKPKVSYSFKGEDLLNPLVVALVQKSDMPITPDDIAAAKKLIADMSAPAEMPLPVGEPDVAGSPTLPTGANPPHPGPPEVVQPLNRRYAESSTTGPQGSRDSAMPTPQK